MIYHKVELSNGRYVNIDLHEDELFSECPKCYTEVQVDIEAIQSMIENGGDFSGTNVYCEKCSKLYLYKE